MVARGDRRPSDAHYLRFAQHPALWRKVSDEFVVPLCRGHHREVHRCGNEIAWRCNAGIDPTLTARALWVEARPLPLRPADLPAATAPPPNASPTDLVKIRGRSALQTTSQDQIKRGYGAPWVT